jgi:hypothetical protein
MDTVWTAVLSEFQPQQTQNFSLFHVVQTGFGARTVSYAIGTGDKGPGREADHSPPISAEVKNT